MFKMREVTFKINKIFTWKRFSLVYLEYFIYLCQQKV